jgi:quercetin dioxygenase-like cupin family protein
MSAPATGPLAASSPVFLHGADVPWVQAGAGVKRQVLCWNDQVMLVRVVFAAGAEGPAHHHPHVQCTLVASGRFELTIGGETRELVAGDSFIVPSGVVHSARALEAGELVDCFTPMREDFL